MLNEPNENRLNMPLSSPPITFVCCIEQGRLESQTVLMLKSLRLFGGGMATIPVFVVKARTGPPLSADTIENLRALNATFVDDSTFNYASWFNFSNKPAAVMYAEKHAKTEYIAWIDSDVLFASEPKGLVLDDSIDFAGRSEYLPPAVHFDNLKFKNYWSDVCRLFNLDYELIPWIDLDVPKVKVRAFFNSGIFSWRRGSGFAEAYLDGFHALIRSRISPSNRQAWYADQVILSLIVVKLGLRWKHLDLKSHHMSFPGHLTGGSAFPSMESSNVIHYSGSLSGQYREVMLERLKNEVSHLYDLVLSHDSSFIMAKPNIFWYLLKLQRKIKLTIFNNTLKLSPDYH